MSLFHILEPETEAEWEAYYRLRYLVLRKPWNQPAASTKDDQENISIHVLMVNEKQEPVAAGRLQINSISQGQVRSMAVHEAYRGKGLGSKVLSYIEKKAKEKNLSKIVLDARQTAVHFYEKHGYCIVEESYVLFNEIQHYKMEKDLFGGSI